MGKNEIIELLDLFTSRRDTSIALANEIEVAIDDAYPDDERLQDVVMMLASYRPGGGEYLYDEDAVIRKLKEIREIL